MPPDLADIPKQVPITLLTMVSPRGLLWLLAVVGASSAHAIEHKKVKCDGGASLVAETTSARVQGFINGTTPNVRQWLGVPYAEPPVGDLRFEPPVRKRHAGPIDTTKWAPTCIQALGSMYPPVLYQEQMGAFLLANGQNEDCLYLNVFAPLNPTAASLPVIIFLPGGELLVGGADTPYLVPAQWVERTQDHIAITIKYAVRDEPSQEPRLTMLLIATASTSLVSPMPRHSSRMSAFLTRGWCQYFFSRCIVLEATC